MVTFLALIVTYIVIKKYLKYKNSLPKDQRTPSDEEDKENTEYLLLFGNK